MPASDLQSIFNVFRYQWDQTQNWQVYSSSYGPKVSLTHCVPTPPRPMILLIHEFFRVNSLSLRQFFTFDVCLFSLQLFMRRWLLFRLKQKKIQRSQKRYKKRYKIQKKIQSNKERYAISKYIIEINVLESVSGD